MRGRSDKAVETVLEGGFVRVPAYFFDCIPWLTGVELKTLLFIARQTLGWNWTAEEFSTGQICRGIGTQHRNAVIAAMRTLEAAGIIKRVSPGPRRAPLVVVMTPNPERTLAYFRERDASAMRTRCGRD